ncbi:Retrovirus-related Pol polyprotein from transposon [Ceratobasidium sp. AG-Ba]|nr:Retrovirus-related Pol polyprotein from transposon [Ceratobasidium sp. AG-Ba]
MRDSASIPAFSLQVRARAPVEGLTPRTPGAGAGIRQNSCATSLDQSNMTKPHQVWAKEHHALGKAVNSTDKDCVLKTISEPPPWLVNLLPKGDQYGDHFNELMNNVGALSSRQLVYAYERDSAYESLAAQLSHTSIMHQMLYQVSAPSTPTTASVKPTYTQKATPCRSNLMS